MVPRLNDLAAKLSQHGIGLERRVVSFGPSRVHQWCREEQYYPCQLLGRLSGTLWAPSRGLLDCLSAQPMSYPYGHLELGCYGPDAKPLSLQLGSLLA